MASPLKAPPNVPSVEINMVDFHRYSKKLHIFEKNHRFDVIDIYSKVANITDLQTVGGQKITALETVEGQKITYLETVQ